MTRLWQKLLILTLTATGLVTSTSGCNVLGVAAYKLAGPTKVPAQYDLPKVPTLVLAEGFTSNGTVSSVDADRLARVVSQRLEADGKVMMVSQDELDKLRASTLADFSAMPVRSIAKAVGARQVVYIDLRDVAVAGTAGSDLYKGNAFASIRVIDTDTGLVAWPVGSAQGSPALFESKPIGKSSRDPASTRAVTLDGLGENIARLFFAWQPESEMPRD